VLYACGKNLLNRFGDQQESGLVRDTCVVRDN